MTSFTGFSKLPYKSNTPDMSYTPIMPKLPKMSIEESETRKPHLGLNDEINHDRNARSNARRDRTRKYWSNRRTLQQSISETFICNNNDNRPFASVTIAGIGYQGLLDSGASITALGEGSEQLLEDPKYKVHNFPSTVKTAGGESIRVFGYIWCDIEFNGIKKPMRIHIVPGLKQKLYLGYDFWKLFDIKPMVVSELSCVEPADPVESNSHELTPDQETVVVKLIDSFPSSSKLGLGKTVLISHSIDVGNAVPVKQRYYPVSPAVQQDLYKELDRMLSLGVIEESRSSWSSPVTLVRKANGKVRLCLDARRVNEVTVKDAYPLPIIDGLLSRLDETRFISSLDLKDAFWQIPLAEESRDKTAFTVPGRPLYHFTVMPFGLCNAPQTMCRLMHRVIPHELQDRVFVYLDDLLITSGTFEDHITLLATVSNYLKEAGLTVNLDKSKFLIKNIKYLGYVVGDGNLRVDSEKVKAITDFPIPKTVKKVRSFLGMTGWYRRFIPSYSAISSPLTDLLRKNCKFIWTFQTECAFNKLKEALSSDPVLIHPNFEKPFFIQCDASTVGLGSVLFQRDDDGGEHPIAYMSQKLNAAQRNYSITELECLAAVLSVKKFRAYVEGYYFTIITDHASLQWLMSQKDLSGRLARWSLKLQSFNFKIEHRKGVQNVVPDALSRDFIDEIEPVDDSGDILHIDLNSEDFLSEDYVNLVHKIQEASTAYENFEIKDGRIYINISKAQIPTDIPTWKLYVPNKSTSNLIKQAHDPPLSAHMGIAKTLERLQRFYFWPKMTDDVRTYINECTICKQTKPTNYSTQPPMGTQFVSVRPMQRLYMDFLGPYPRSKSGNCYLLIVLDQYSKYVFLKSMRQAVSSEVIRYLEKDIFLQYSVPETLLTDNGSQFNSKCLKEVLAKYGVQHIQTPRYSPQSNASERVNRSILSAIRSYIKDDHQNWDVNLNEITCALRNVVHGSTKYSPHYLMFGQHIITHGNDYKLLKELNLLGEGEILVESKANRLSLCQKSVLQNLKQAYDRGANQYNLRSRDRNLIVGQKVFVKNYVLSNAPLKFSAKLAPKFVEAKIVRRVGNVAFELVRPDGKSIGIYHTKDIRS